MKYILFFTLLFLMPILFVQAIKPKTGFDRTEFYLAISSSNLELINSQISEIKESSIPEKEAYEGALLMKKSGLIKAVAKEKLNFFKSGRLKLESAIVKDTNNIEYRFLRFIIQENAPKIVKYKGDMNTDGALIRSHYKNLPEALRKIILDYNKISKVLKIPT